MSASLSRTFCARVCSGFLSAAGPVAPLKYTKPAPVVMMITAYGDDENYTIAKKLGADDFLTKPVDFNLLKEKLIPNN